MRGLRTLKDPRTGQREAGELLCGDEEDGGGARREAGECG